MYKEKKTAAFSAVSIEDFCGRDKSIFDLLKSYDHGSVKKRVKERVLGGFSFYSTS